MLITSKINFINIQRRQNRRITKRWKEAIMMKINNIWNKAKAWEIKWLKI